MTVDAGQATAPTDAELLQTALGLTDQEVEALKALLRATHLIMDLPGVRMTEESSALDREEMGTKLNQLQQAILARPAMRELSVNIGAAMRLLESP